MITYQSTPGGGYSWKVFVRVCSSPMFSEILIIVVDPLNWLDQTIPIFRQKWQLNILYHSRHSQALKPVALFRNCIPIHIIKQNPHTLYPTPSPPPPPLVGLLSHSLPLILHGLTDFLSADSWPQVLEDSNARKDWEWAHEYDLNAMTLAMLEALAPTAKFTAANVN